jgi:hypothetical protein
MSSRELAGLPLKRSRRRQKKKHPYSPEDKVINNIIWKDLKELIELEIEREAQLFKRESDRINLSFIREFNEKFSSQS